MVQGFKTSKKILAHAHPFKKTATGSLRKTEKAKMSKKGSSLKLPNGRFRDAALDDRDLSKAIDKANEQKVAAKLLQAGGKIAAVDLKAAGKEYNKNIRRTQLKRKLTRVEEKLKLLPDDNE
jgi:hypothetical protein